MAKTREQKVRIVDDIQELLDKSRLLLFADFNKVSVEDFKKLRRTLKGVGAVVKIIKKRLLRVALQKKGIEFNPEQFEQQLATVFSPAEITDVAPPIYKFSKEAKREKKGDLNILGAYDLNEKSFIDAERANFIGQLPPREVLLAQLAGLLMMPLKMLMYVLSEKSKKVG